MKNYDVVVIGAGPGGYILRNPLRATGVFHGLC